MTSFAGIINKKQDKVDPGILDRMIAGFDAGQNAKKVFSHRFALAVISTEQPGSGTDLAPIYEDEQHIGCYDGRIDQGFQVSDSTIERDKIYLFKYVFKYVLKYVYSKPADLRGDFAIALYDKREDRLTLVRDQLGTRPLYYVDHPNYLAFATEMHALKALPSVTTEMDEQWLADAISTVKSEKWRTPYVSIRRLLPGHMLHMGREVRIASYWDLEFQNAFESLSYEEALDGFNQRLIHAVDQRTKGSKVLASELSGGLDSSGVTALGFKQAVKGAVPFYALTHAFSDDSLGNYFPYNDERTFSQAVCSHLGLSHHIMCDADGYGLLDMLKRQLFIQSGPTQQGYSMFSDTLYDRGKGYGVDRLLSGFGGDEGVTSKAGGIFEELAKSGQWDLYRREFFQKANVEKKNEAVALSKYLVKRYLPFAKSFLNRLRGKSDWRAEKYPGLGFTEEFESRLQIKKRFYERLGFPDDPDVRARQYKRIMHDHVSQRFEYSYLDARAWGIEYAYPLWDIDLIGFYYSLPAQYKFRNGMGRAIWRDAMKGLLPDKVRLRNDKTGATVPTVQQRFLKDYDAITDLILRSKQHNSYHYLDYDKMLAWQKRIKNRGFNDKIPANPAAFFNSLQILLLQEMEREGTFKSGIR